MEQKFELIYMGAAAIIFVTAVMGWFTMEKQLNQCLSALEWQLNDERVVMRSGGN